MAEILHQLICSLSHYLIIYRVLYIPGGAGFQPSTVSRFLPSNIYYRLNNKFDFKKSSEQERFNVIANVILMLGGDNLYLYLPLSWEGIPFSAITFNIPNLWNKIRNNSNIFFSGATFPKANLLPWREIIGP